MGYWIEIVMIGLLGCKLTPQKNPLSYDPLDKVEGMIKHPYMHQKTKMVHFG